MMMTGADIKKLSVKNAKRLIKKATDLLQSNFLNILTLNVLSSCQQLKLQDSLSVEASQGVHQVLEDIELLNPNNALGAQASHLNSKFSAQRP